MHKPSNYVPNPDDGFEVTDANVKLIVIAAVIATILTLLSFGIAFMYTKFLVSDSRAYSPEGSYTGVKPGATDWTASTRLQGTPELDLKEHRDHATALSHSIGAVDEAAGIYHIPVDEALNLVAEAGVLPTFKSTEKAAESAH